VTITLDDYNGRDPFLYFPPGCAPTGYSGLGQIIQVQCTFNESATAL